jgi:hypothetical protein
MTADAAAVLPADPSGPLAGEAATGVFATCLFYGRGQSGKRYPSVHSWRYII